MISCETKVINKTGLHARPAAMLCGEANKFKSDIKIKKLDDKGMTVNAKSIIRILSLGVSPGTSVAVIAEGEDEELAVKYIVDLINSGFGEV